MLSTTTSAAHKKPADTNEKGYQNNSKTFKIQLQTLLLTIMLNNLKHQ